MPTRDEKDKFSSMIEQKATDLGIAHMEMIVDYCSKSGMEIETAASLLNNSLKSKIEIEARAQRSLRK